MLKKLPRQLKTCVCFKDLIGEKHQDTPEQRFISCCSEATRLSRVQCHKEGMVWNKDGGKPGKTVVNKEERTLQCGKETTLEYCRQLK